MTDKIDARLQIAARAGADWAGNPETDDVVGEITRREPELLDAVFECSGEQEAMDQGVQLLKPGGKLLLIGIPGARTASRSTSTCCGAKRSAFRTSAGKTTAFSAPLT